MTESKIENGKTLYHFQFIMADGTIESVWAEDRYTAAKIARENYYGK